MGFGIRENSPDDLLNSKSHSLELKLWATHCMWATSGEVRIGQNENHRNIAMQKCQNIGKKILTLQVMKILDHNPRTSHEMDNYLSTKSG